MKCPNCSIENSDGMAFCGNCGSPLAPPVDTVATAIHSQSINTRKPLVILSIAAGGVSSILCVCALIFVLILYPRSQTPDNDALAKVDEIENPTPIPLPIPTQPILIPSTPQTSKCDQPSVHNAMLRARERATSVRIVFKEIQNSVETNTTLEQVIENAGVSSHIVISAKNAEKTIQIQEMIVIRDSGWERQGNGVWSSAKPITTSIALIGPSRSESWSPRYKIQGKVGTMQYANQPIDIYWITDNDQQGTLYLNPNTCLPVLESTSNESVTSNNLPKKKITITYEWNIPFKITPPRP